MSPVFSTVLGWFKEAIGTKPGSGWGSGSGSGSKPAAEKVGHPKSSPA